MEEVSTIGLDIAKSVFQAHGADAAGRELFSKRVTRAKLLEFFARQPHRGNGDRGPCARDGDLPSRAGFRSLARIHTKTEVDRWQDQARPHLEDG